MKSRHLAIVLTSFVCATLWASAQDKPDRKPVPPKAAKTSETKLATSGTNRVSALKFPVIGYLEGRERIIVIKAGAQGPVYSVKDLAGKTLFENLSAKELQAKAPEVHDFIKSAVAINCREPGVKVDASLRIAPR